MLVVDLECTCGLGVPNEQAIQEIIEVGMSRIDAAGSDPSPGVSYYVRPVTTPINKFCTRLTGITPDTVKGRPIFEDAVIELKAIVRSHGSTAWASWGEFDHQAIERQCERLGVPNPFEGVVHVNLKPLLSPIISRLTGVALPRGAHAGIGLKSALKMLGMEFAGRPHSGADDAYNAARICSHVQRALSGRSARLAASGDEA